MGLLSHQTDHDFVVSRADIWLHLVLLFIRWCVAVSPPTYTLPGGLKSFTNHLGRASADRVSAAKIFQFGALGWHRRSTGGAPLWPFTDGRRTNRVKNRQSSAGAAAAAAAAVLKVSLRACSRSLVVSVVEKKARRHWATGCKFPGRRGDWPRKTVGSAPQSYACSWEASESKRGLGTTAAAQQKMWLTTLESPGQTDLDFDKKFDKTWARRCTTQRAIFAKSRTNAYLAKLILQTITVTHLRALLVRRSSPTPPAPSRSHLLPPPSTPSPRKPAFDGSSTWGKGPAKADRR